MRGNLGNDAIIAGFGKDFVSGGAGADAIRVGNAGRRGRPCRIRSRIPRNPRPRDRYTADCEILTPVD